MPAVISPPVLRRVGAQTARELFRGAAEDVGAGQAPAASAPFAPVPSASQGETGDEPSQTPALDQLTIDLTARARAGEIDPIVGRDAEIRQVIDILSRRRQNNPILVGEAGVGKRRLLYEFADWP